MRCHSIKSAAGRRAEWGVVDRDATPVRALTTGDLEAMPLRARLKITRRFRSWRSLVCYATR